ncbi:MAG: hypothetical protein WC323_03910 [Patescibacteria group bacterium]|jgi:hypothetical protein
MAEVKPPINKEYESEALINWDIPEYDRYERGKTWYIIAIIVALAALIIAFWVENYLFAIIIVLSALIITINQWREPAQINFSIHDEGLLLGRKFIDYSELRNFAIIYKPRQDIKKLYFEFESVFKPRLSIYLDNINPLKIRDILLNYLQEDLERENEPLSESLAKLFRL